jgi:hypothetical protein
MDLLDVLFAQPNHADGFSQVFGEYFDQVIGGSLSLEEEEEQDPEPDDETVHGMIQWIYIQRASDCEL